MQAMIRLAAFNVVKLRKINSNLALKQALQ